MDKKDSQKSTGGVKIPRAIYIAEDGSRTVVGLSRKDTLADEVYNPEKHDPRAAGGRLVCETCNDVDVHFSKGSVAKGGDQAPGSKAHFASNPGQAHKHTQECRDEASLEASENKKYDDDKGFRLHLNTGAVSTIFNEARVYEPTDKGGIRLRQKFNRLADMEPVSIGSAREFLKVFQPSKKGVSRLHSSFLIARDFLPVPWNKFFVKYKAPYTGMKAIIERNEDEVALRRQPSLFLAKPMQIETKTRRGGSKFVKIKCHPMDLGENDMGVTEKVFPQIFVDAPSIREKVEKHGLRSLLVLGRPKIRRYQAGENEEHIYVDYTINDPREVCFDSVKDLVERRKSRLGEEAYDAPATNIIGKRPQP